MTAVVVESPVLSPQTLREIARRMLHLASADAMSVAIEHVATSTARVARGRVRLNASGDTLRVQIESRFGTRRPVTLRYNQIDDAALRRAVAYLDDLARAQPGDAAPVEMPIRPITYAPSCAWYDTTARAYGAERSEVVPQLVRPLLSAGLSATAFAGVYARSVTYVDTQGLSAMGHETDAELTAVGWTLDGHASGWAGQADRDWTRLRPDDIAHRALRLTQLGANPVAVEPGRRTVILDRPAVAQLVRQMGAEFDASTTFMGQTALFDRTTGRPKLGRQIVDVRLTLSSDPNDPEAGFLPFNRQAEPLVPMVWIDRGVATNLAFSRMFAAAHGVTPSNDSPDALRLIGATRDTAMTVEQMIGACDEGIYVNRFAYVGPAGGADATTGMLGGVTSGGCFLVKRGKIEKSIKNLRFLESPWFAFNRIEAIGTSERAPFGYAPWTGDWPVAPTVVPPLMIRDFSFSSLADSV